MILFWGLSILLLRYWECVGAFLFFSGERVRNDEGEIGFFLFFFLFFFFLSKWMSHRSTRHSGDLQSFSRRREEV